MKLNCGFQTYSIMEIKNGFNYLVFTIPTMTIEACPLKCWIEKKKKKTGKMKEKEARFPLNRSECSNVSPQRRAKALNSKMDFMFSCMLNKKLK